MQKIALLVLAIACAFEKCAVRADKDEDAAKRLRTCRRGYFKEILTIMTSTGISIPAPLNWTG
jgi:hypothetical protein